MPSGERSRWWPIARALAVCGVLLLLLYGLLREWHEVRSRTDDAPEQISGSAFTRGATVDRYERRGDVLYDTHSQRVPESATLDDCPT